MTRSTYFKKVLSQEHQMVLAQLPQTYLANLLLENPKTQYFALGVSDFPFSTYPQGVPRASVLAAYKTAAMQLGNFNLTTIGSDNFQRANENPLSQGGNWQNAPVGNLQVLNNQCSGIPPTPGVGNGTSDGAAVYSGQFLPNDQWVSVTIGDWIYGASLQAGNTIQSWTPILNLGLRSSFGSANGYTFSLSALNIIPFGGVGTGIFIANSGGVLVSGPGVLTAMKTGDVVTAIAIGLQVFLFINGALVANTTDTTGEARTSGYAGLELISDFSNLDFNPYPTIGSVTNFACGAASGGPNLNIS
jgi:hypothetical protein